MTWQDLKIGDIVHMTYHDGDDVYTLYSHVTNIQANEITFSDLYCDKGPDFIDNRYQISFPKPAFTFIAVVGHNLPSDLYFKSLFPELFL